MLVTAVITRLPPAIDGVGDYALHLAIQLRNDLGIETHFVVGDPTWKGATQIQGFNITQVSDCSADSLLSVLPSDRSSPNTLLLHYVNYGYAKRGCPVWLVDGLQRWRTLSVNRLMVTMFHETYVSGRPPWTSSFWLSPLQKNLATRLARLSDRCLTSRQDYAKLLYKLSRGKHPQIPTLPVFSNIGEPKQVPPLSERKRGLVVFGSPSHRLKAYRESLAQLELTCELLGIEEISDIGQSTNIPLSSVNGVPVVELGHLCADKISDLMLNSLAGFFDYNPDFLAKSGIFAAYCAHGLLPVSAGASALSVDDIEAQNHYWVPDRQTINGNVLVQLQAIADNAHRWYQTHNLPVHAKTFAALLGNKK
ncbi:MAG: glycosyltransferase family 1 protein [Cyanobacteriota bacterium]